MSIARTTSTRYTKLLSLGKGGMGEAHLAVSSGSAGVRKACVLKELHPQLLREPAARKLFFHEAQIASKLDHPKIVCTYDFGEDDEGNLFLAMEYVHGQPWSRVRAQLGPMRLPLVAHVRILRDLLDALDHAHDFVDFDDRPLHVVHRDVAPGNVMVDYSGRVKLLDFGISKSVDSRSLVLGRGFKGKLPYVSPEQVAGKTVDRRADLYAVAAMLWESIARRKRCEGEVEEVLAARVRGAEPRIEDVVPDVDLELSQICSRGLSVRPGDRYATAAEMASALDAWLAPREGDMPRRVWAPHVRAKYEEDRAKVRKILLDELGALADAPYATSSYATMTSLFPSSPSQPPPAPRSDAELSDDAATVVQPSTTGAFPASAFPTRPPPGDLAAGVLVSPPLGALALSPPVTFGLGTSPVAFGVPGSAPPAEDSGRDSLDPKPTTLSAPVPPFVAPPRRSQAGWAIAAALMVAVAVVAVVAVVRGPARPAAASPAEAPSTTTSAPAVASPPVVPAQTTESAPVVPSETATTVQDKPEPKAPHGHAVLPRGSKPSPSAPPEPSKPSPPTARPLDEADPYK